jgi:hypothetical protein
VGFCSSFFELEAKFYADSLLLKIRHFSWRKNRRTTKTRYRNARNSRTRPLSLPAVGILIHKGYCSAHLTAEGRTTTGSLALFKFPELLGSTSYE